MTKQTEKALTGLEWAIAQTIKSPQEDDEFTAEEFAKEAKLEISQARNRLDHMASRGQLTKRKVSINNRLTNVFRKAD